MYLVPAMSYFLGIYNHISFRIFEKYPLKNHFINCKAKRESRDGGTGRQRN